MTRSMISDSKVTMDFWGEAVCTAVHIKDRIKSSVHNRIPYELWTGRKPTVKYMKRFGYVAYVPEKGVTKRKFDAITVKSIFVGYATNNTYRVYMLRTNGIRCDCDVKFDEKRNGVKVLHGEEMEDHLKGNDLVFIGIDGENNSRDNEMDRVTERHIIDTVSIEESDEFDDDERRTTTEELQEENDTEIENVNNEREIQGSVQINEQREEITKRRGRPNGSAREAIEIRKQLEEKERRQTEVKGNVRRSHRTRDKNLAMIVMDEEISMTVEEARNTGNWKNWKEAIDEEMECMKKHKVWDIVQCPEEKRVINNKWVYSIKESNIKQSRYKAGLVTVGCGQRPDFDYDETFAPVVRMELLD